MRRLPLMIVLVFALFTALATAEVRADEGGRAVGAAEPGAAPEGKAGLADLGKDESVASYERKSITYLKTLRRASVPGDVYGIIDAAVRRSVELPRFDYNDVGHLAGLGPQEAAEAVRRYLDEIKLERARTQADYDLRFKDFSITGEDLRRIANSAYLYQPSIDGLSLNRRQYVQVINGVRRVSYQWEARLNVSVHFYTVDFEQGKATRFKTLRSSGSGSAAITAYLGGDQARRSAVAKAAESVALTLSRDVRNVDEFRLLTPISAASFNSVTFGLTRKEGLGLDQGFYVYDYLSTGKRERVGYVRVRRVGDGKRLDSDAQNITVKNGWSFEEGQLVEENPQLGIRLNIEGGVQELDIAPVPELGLTGTRRGVRFGLGGEYSIANATGISELYTGLDLHAMATDAMLEVGGQAGLDKRFYIRRLVLVPGFRVGYLRTSWQFPESTLQQVSRFETYKGSSVGVTPRIGAEFFITPSFSLGLRAGYRLYTTQVDLELDKSSEEDENAPATWAGIDAHGFNYSPSGLEIMGGINITF